MVRPHRPGRHLYLMQMDRTGAFKVGRSSNVARRRGEVQTGCPYEVRVILIVEGKGHLEPKLHERLAAFRTRQYSGEWFHEEGLASLPDWIYEQLDLERSDWWIKNQP